MKSSPPVFPRIRDIEARKLIEQYLHPNYSELQPDGSYLPTKITRLTNLYKMWNRRVDKKT